MGFKDIETLPRNPYLVPATIGAMGNFANTTTQTAQYRGDESTAETNAVLSRMSAEEARKQGERESEVYGNAFRSAYGQKAANIAGGGVDITKGSAFSSLMDFSKGGALDMATIRNNAANRALGFNQEADLYELQAKMAKQKAAAAVGSGLLTGGLQFLNTLQSK